MLHRIGSLCLRYLRAKGPPRLHYGCGPLGGAAGAASMWPACSRATLASSARNTLVPASRLPPASHKLWLAFGVASLMQFLGLTEEKEDSELIQILKKAELALLSGDVLQAEEEKLKAKYQLPNNWKGSGHSAFLQKKLAKGKKEYKKSEQLFHIALKLAQELQYENGITFIYDRLANIAFDIGHFEKSRKLFVQVMQRLLDNGMEKDNLALIHISFKLAKIFENIGDYRTAAVGLQYCLDTLRPKLVKESPDYADALALWLMLLNGYAYFLYYVGRSEEAFKYFKEVRAVREQIGGEDDEQLVLLLNNLGTVSKLRGDTEAALGYFQEAEKLGKSIDSMENFSFVYLNLAYLYMELKVADKAREYCERAMMNATRHGFEEGKKESEECLSKVKEALG